jgi:hypothetical protein
LAAGVLDDDDVVEVLVVEGVDSDFLVVEAGVLSLGFELAGVSVPLLEERLSVR